MGARKGPFGFGEGQQWDPRFPEAASGVRAVGVDGVPEEEITAAELDSSWVRTADLSENDPNYSHVWGFRWTDQLDRPSARNAALGKSLTTFVWYLPHMLFVRFKARTSKNGRQHPVTEYAYWFGSPEEARAVFEQMKATDHPGEIVQRVLIAGGVPYEKLR